MTILKLPLDRAAAVTYFGSMSSKAKRMSKAEEAAHLAAVGKRIGTCACGGPVMAQASLINLYTVCGSCWKTVILKGR